MPMIDVLGYCPMGCGKTLHLNPDSGMIACLDRSCPSPLAVTKLLAADTVAHTVKIERTGWAVEHPLKERVTGSLFDCALTDWLEALDRAPVSAGLYRVTEVEPGIESIPENEVAVDGWSFRKETES